MSTAAARLQFVLNELRLPTVKRLWAVLAEQSNKEGWPAERFLVAVMEHELAERDTRRLERHRLESQLLPANGSRTLISRWYRPSQKHTSAHWRRVTAGLDRGESSPVRAAGVGKSHLVCAIGNGLIDRGIESASRAPAIWCSVCKGHDAKCGFRRRLLVLIALIC